MPHRFHLLGDRRQDRIREEDAGEGADQRRADQSAEDLRGLVERPHGVDDAEHRGHDAKRRQSVRDRLKGVHWLISIVREGLDFFVHQRFDLMRARIADNDQAPVVADERHQIFVRQQLWEVLEDFGFLRVVEMRFDFAARLGSELSHQRMQGREHIEKVTRLGRLVEHRLYERLAAVLDRRHSVGDDENAKRRSGDDDELERLKQHLEVSAKRRIAAEDTADGDHEAYGEVQEFAPNADAPKTCGATLTRSCARTKSATDKPTEPSSP